MRVVGAGGFVEVEPTSWPKKIQTLVQYVL